ncbi:MAG: UDP-3-O-(3-hydroxymyristoyl)glucosamine N-acyltransferase [Deltaproteobacteria bacterium]|nr:UDP-3-O-(3-hydroxymyristoyl)glucosamine N-acyltransferase [Deltaproteobacteria bacterium]
MAKEKRLAELAELSGGRVAGDGSVIITGVASIDEAGPGDITFVSDRKYVKLLKTTRASAVIVREEGAAAGLNLLVVKNPQTAFSQIVDIFKPAYVPAPGIHPKAEVSALAALGNDVSVQPFAVIEEGARIGDRSVIHSGVYIGKDARIGDDTVLYPGVAVREGCIVGSRVIIHCNAVVGSDGFGYARSGASYIKIPQRGIVRIEDDVEIGACVTIDRAAIGETVIEKGVKIDNLVQIAHNVKIGPDTVMAAQTGIAGSARVGGRVQFGGQSGIAGHIEIGSDTMIGAKAGVISSVPPGSILSGFPAISHGEWLRAQAVFGKLPELKKKIAELEERLKGLEEGSAERDKKNG